MAIGVGPPFLRESLQFSVIQRVINPNLDWRDHLLIDEPTETKTQFV